jgi:hypothetical protein
VHVLTVTGVVGAYGASASTTLKITVLGPGGVAPVAATTTGSSVRPSPSSLAPLLPPQRRPALSYCHPWRTLGPVWLGSGGTSRRHQQRAVRPSISLSTRRGRAGDRDRCCGRKLSMRPLFSRRQLQRRRRSSLTGGGGVCCSRPRWPGT